VGTQSDGKTCLHGQVRSVRRTGAAQSGTVPPGEITEEVAHGVLLQDEKAKPRSFSETKRCLADDQMIEDFDVKQLPG